MREIKFRARVNGGYVYSKSYINLAYYFDATNDYPQEQFTGLYDKNGKEIYEGDILSYPSMHTKNLGELFNNVVEFATGQSLCGWRMRNKSCVVKATPYKFLCSEVIGSIYENPELVTPNP